MRLIKRLSVVGLVLAGLYLAIFSFLFAHVTFSPQPDGGEWYFMYFISFPVSAGIEALRGIGCFPDNKVIRVLAYAIGSSALWYLVGAFLGRIFSKGNKP
jgi:hypothetical protein